MRNTNKCGKCRKRVINLQFRCKECRIYLHKKCVQNNNVEEIMCNACLNKHLPFFKVTNNDFLNNFNDKLNAGNLPSFKIQSLLDEIKKNENEDNSFLSDSIKSSYFTPSEFVENKFTKKAFSIIHLNVASLGRHIDELKSLLFNLKHEFDVITLSEVKIRNSTSSLINIDMEVYDCHITKTNTNCGGTIIYVKNSFS